MDLHVVGNLNREPATPRPCLFAQVSKQPAGEGGPDMKASTCPYCKTNSQRICYYMTYAPGVASAYGQRQNGKIKDSAWRKDAEPQTVQIDGQEIRFFIFKRQL